MDPLIEAARLAWGDAAEKALLTTAEEVLKAAKADAPYDPKPDPGGHLRDKGHLDEIKRHGGGSMSIDIVFDGPYAAKQHERTDYKHPHGGKAKFLEHNLTNSKLAEHLAAAESEVLR